MRETLDPSWVQFRKGCLNPEIVDFTATVFYLEWIGVGEVQTKKVSSRRRNQKCWRGKSNPFM